MKKAKISRGSLKRQRKLTEQEFDKALNMVLLAVAKKGAKLMSENRNVRRRVADLSQADRLDKTIVWAKVMLKKIFKHAPQSQN